MAKKKKIVKKRKIKKSRLIIIVFLLLIFVFLLSFLFKLLFVSNADERNSKKNDVKENQSKKVELEHLSLDNESSDHKFKVLIDPGHGGSDIGTKGVEGVLEKGICLSIGKKVAGVLSQYDDLEVILTRSEDTYVSVEDRIKMANSQNVDAVISIEANAQSGRNDAYGIETYYQQNGVVDSEKLAKSIQGTICLYLNTRDRGTYPSNLEILKKTDMPSALVEVGFITNEKETKKLKTESYQNKMAEGIAQGILRYIDSKNK
ncbi:N-acetylmuramoyl-L-alanine amidase family protein [Paraclostridium sordellii]|uniref:N-acetylmuramoyl-L-alanine amidase n=1 Tax=Paraclostridium sordellii TaxID=1505 RepID=A0A0C7G8V3_PARSO|nr:N-acetylmuramoyl-L-alanine amidase [Paeniclostridium sordellii]CEN79748.1 N-acetylmuramoyl-L-alanine amidase [[Clostridium] sordellii] [Paeniclostridium sordellii]CEO12230.1 N-acetylmuramoyl-L-alanine amidase [[Clostridium] sordellii] [Paeniclostridium sordellii]CEP87795.1 N-acetylmuramoyl-L-alanine amidase [[Clostridium] sordellii] [Paeniclostridium sordellii]CEP97469.1 N-acetylmuramoyl-L-alanine amidase [[Clostridium] sordellii] [Paeniclostridium sordellii]CEQ01157.1 N-acetylmuramoyl-L-al